MRSLRAAYAVAIPALSLLAACAGNVEPLPPDFAIRDRTVWAGTQVVVESPAFVGSALAPRIRMGSEWLPVQRAGDDAFAASVPNTAAGTYTVDIEFDGELRSLPPVDVAGMTAARRHSTFFPMDLQVLPGSGHATLFGGAVRPNSSRSPLTFFDLDTGGERPLAGPLYDWDGLRGPGVSYRPGVYFGQMEGETGITAFRLDAAGTTPLEEPPVGESRMVIEVGPGAYVRGFHHEVSMPGRRFRIEESEGAVISHAAGRATFKADNSSFEGLPVFSTPDGALAYVLTDVTDPAGVDFSPDGELLAIAQAGPSAILRVYRAGDGAVVQERALPASPFAVAFDPERPLLYVGVNGLSETFAAPALLVLDRATLADVAQLSTEGSGVTCTDFCYKGVIAVSAEPAVYIAASFFMPLVSFRFSLPED